MATRRKTVAKPSREEREPRQREERSDRDLNDSRGGRSQQSGKSEFVNVTKLFESRKNQDILIGTVSEEYLEKLENLIADARDANKGITFFVMLDGKWGPNLSATLARDQQPSGDRGGDRRNRTRWQR